MTPALRQNLTLAVLVLTGINMRPLLTSIGPLLPDIRAASGMSYTLAALLTALPVIAMGVLALAAGWVDRYIGQKRSIALSLLIIAAGALLREIAPNSGLLLTSALAGGIGIGIIQAAIPAVIKHLFPRRTPLVMGLWSAALMGGGGIGAAISPWLNGQLGWQGALSSWAVPVMLAILLWLFITTPRAARTEAAALPSLWRKTRAWTLALSFGLVNGGYAICVAWLPDFYHQLGWSAQAGGSLLGMMIGCQVTGALLLPLLARGRDRRPLLLLTLAMQFSGMLGFLFAPQLAPWLWAGIAGFGLGGAFPLALVLALDHLEQPQAGARLVAFMQGVGFIIAGSMPFIAGQLHALTGHFTSVWLLQAAVTLLLIVLNLRFHPRSYQHAFPEVNR